MNTTFAIALLSACVSAVRMEPTQAKPEIAKPEDLKHEIAVKPKEIAPLPLDEELAPSESCYSDCYCRDNCDCSLAIGCGGLAGGVTCGSAGGSYAYQAASNESIPDKLYIVDAVSCSDETSTATEDYCRNDLGNHTFSISGEITIAESFDASSNNKRQGRE